MYQTIVSVDDLKSHLNDPNWVIIDTRYFLKEPEKGHNDYLKNHISGAIFADLDKDLSGPIQPGITGRHPLPSVDKLIALFSSWGIDSTVQVVVYDQAHGGIAARLWWMLQWMGHQQVAVLDGGFAAWDKAAAPLESATPKLTPRSFEVNIQKNWTTSAPQIGREASQENYCLIDARAAIRYRGEQEPIDPIAGHIPHALSLPFLDNLNEEGLWRSPEELKARFEPVVGNAEKVVVYCGSGVKE